MTARDRIAASPLPRHEIERLVMAVTGRSRAELMDDTSFTPEEAAALAEMERARLAGEPLQYIEGVIPFGPAEIAVDRRALIPRPETEYLYELAVAAAGPDPAIIADIGTGSGCLAVSLALRFPEARVIATDISPSALALAHENAVRNRVTVEFHLGDLYAALPRDVAGRIEVLVANLPYVSAAEMEELPDEVRRWEPHVALHGGDDGLALIRPLMADLATWIAPDGVALIEVGEAHAHQAAAQTDPVFEPAEVVNDLTGRPRFVRVTSGSRRFEVVAGDGQ